MYIGKKTFTIAIILLSILLLVSLTACNDSDSTEYSKDPIDFAEPLFGELLKTSLNVDEISEADLAIYTEVQVIGDQFVLVAATGAGIPIESIVFFSDDTFEYRGDRYNGHGSMKTLEDLNHFPNLTMLYIYYQPQVDYTTVPWEEIRILNIHDANLRKVDFLGEASNLKSVSLSDNELTDIEFVTELTSLERIYIDWNRVSDISPLASLPNLENFSSFGNNISDLTPLKDLTKLQKLEMFQNKVKDISVLSGLPNLTQIHLINNEIEDVSPLAGFTNLERLTLSGNPVKNLSVLSHISNLEYEEDFPRIDW